MKTILFSNVMGDVFDKSAKVSFLPKMKEIVSSWGLKNPEIVYVDAPMEGYDNMAVFDNIKKCFAEITGSENIHFVGTGCDSLVVENESNTIYFLTGGNPLTQREIIKEKKLGEQIKNAKFCIGFCAGAMNLSKYGILTSDDDFETPMVYKSLGRVDISIEPHFNFEWQAQNEPEKYQKRLGELRVFVGQIKEPIYAIPDTSFIYVDEGRISEFGEIIKFEKQNGKVLMKRKNIMSWNGVEFEAIIATPGCGKSYLCDKFSERFVDVDEVRLRLKYFVPENITREELERTKGERPFKKRLHTAETFKAIVPVLDKYRHEGKILISAPHSEIFDYFQSRGIKTCFVFPDKDMRETVKNRFVERENPESFIKENDDMFDEFWISNNKETRVACKYAFGKDEYLEDILKKFGLKF